MISYSTTPTPYDSARDLLSEDDTIEMDISVEGWSRTLRIRSLTVPQREKINRAAGVGKDRDWETYCASTLVEGVTCPRLNPTVARELVESHNGELVEELVQAIWNLGSLQKVYAKYREELRALNAAKDQLPEQSVGH